jgi:multisubunit Na+/H+ antiporter MnhE subunit
VSVSVLIVVLLAGIWLLLLGEVGAGQIVLGLCFGALFVRITGAGRGVRVGLVGLPRRLGYLAFFLLLLLPWSVVRANLDMARRLLRRKPALEPAIVGVPLGERISEIALGLEEHAITLTPGQALVDYSTGDRTAYIHVISEAGALRDADGLWRSYRRILTAVFS